jgi:hypothetical protein
VLRRRLALVLTTTMLVVMMLVAMAGAALAVPPQNGHACYGSDVYSFLHGGNSITPEPVSGHPGNETADDQQFFREELANCGANQGGSNF